MRAPARLPPGTGESEDGPAEDRDKKEDGDRVPSLAVDLEAQLECPEPLSALDWLATVIATFDYYCSAHLDRSTPTVFCYQLVTLDAPASSSANILAESPLAIWEDFRATPRSSRRDSRRSSDFRQSNRSRSRFLAL